MDSLRRFLAELRRRKVYHVAVVYAAVAFVVWQVADIAFPSLGLSERAVGGVLILTVLGFPLALVLAWAYELRPEEPARPSSTAPALTRPPAPSARDNSVAILPFQSMAHGEEDEYFADGIAEEITNVLAGLAGLHVAARTSAFSFKGRPADIREIGRKLDVAYVVEGSVRRAGATLRITAQLVDTTTGYHLWSRRFDRTIDDVFVIQDEIASAVADRLSRQVEASAPAPRLVPRTKEMTAYEAYLKGRHLMADFDVRNVLEATERFEEAIARDPGFAAAHASLADALTLQSIGFQARPDREIMPRARSEAERALELDPRLPEGHLARALVAMFHEWDYPTARGSFDRAAELGPNVARVHMWREFLATYVDHDFGAALAANKRCQELSPLDLAPRTREATVLYLFGECREAERMFRAMIEEAPSSSLAYNGLADSLARQGRIDEAVPVMERAVEVGGATVAWLGILGLLYGLQGARDKARDVIRRLEDRAREGYASRFWMAMAHSGTGDLDAAFSDLDAAIEARDGNLLYAFFSPRATGLHADPRFPGVLRAINLSHLIPHL